MAWLHMILKMLLGGRNDSKENKRCTIVKDYTTKRDKPIFGIIWKKDLEKIVILSLNVREYHVKNISDIRYFKNTKAIWIIYRGAYEGDTSIYEEDNLLDNIYVAKNLKNLEMISLYHIKVNKDIKAMFPNVKVSIE